MHRGRKVGDAVLGLGLDRALDSRLGEHLVGDAGERARRPVADPELLGGLFALAKGAFGRLLETLGEEMGERHAMRKVTVGLALLENEYVEVRDLEALDGTRTPHLLVLTPLALASEQDARVDSEVRHTLADVVEHAQGVGEALVLGRTHHEHGSALGLHLAQTQDDGVGLWCLEHRDLEDGLGADVGVAHESDERLARRKSEVGAEQDQHAASGMWINTKSKKKSRKQEHSRFVSSVVLSSTFSMRREVVLDIETRNTFQDVGAYNPALLQVSLVGCYFYETDTFEAFLQEDLPKLWPRLERADRIVGYNLIGFDYPCLQTHYSGDMMRLPTVDLLMEIEKKLGFRVKLDDVAQATLGVGKSGHGLMAVEYWKKGEIEKLKEYCLQDVRVTRDVYDYALQNGHVRLNNRMGQLQEIPMTIEPPEPNSRQAINLSFGL